MILQSDNPIRMVRELAGAPITLIYAMMCARQRVSQRWLEEATGFSDKTVSKNLSYLQEVGLADHTRAGWQLVKENAKQLPLVSQLEEEASHEDPEEAQEGEGSQDTTQIEETQEGLSETHGPNKQRPDQHEEQNVLSRRNSDSLNYLSKLVVVDSNNINNSPTNLTNLSEQAGNFPTPEKIQEIRRVLDAAEELFGQRLLGDEREYADIDRLLAWIAKTYDGFSKSNKSKIFNPVGMIYWAFHRGKDARIEKRYMDLSWFELMNERDGKINTFMHESGQWIYDDDDGTG